MFIISFFIELFYGKDAVDNYEKKKKQPRIKPKRRKQ